MPAGVCEDEREDMARTTVAVSTATRDRIKEIAARIGRESRPPRAGVSYDEVIQLALASYEKELRRRAK